MAGSLVVNIRDKYILIVIIAVALILRLWGVGFGLPELYHADEERIVNHALAFGLGDLNPHYFNYPSFSMYLLSLEYGLFLILGRVLGFFSGVADFEKLFFHDPTYFYLIGRVTSVLLGTATVGLIYLLGKKAYGRGAGLMAAFLMAVPEQAPGFLVGGFSLPLYLRGKPAPPALFQQVTDKPRLIYYHWELTQPRVEMLWHAFNYWNIVHAYLPPKKDGAVASWLRDKGLVSCLGNTVTQATLESPTEIRVVRSAAVGFTAYELIRLARWLDGKDFPLVSRPVTVVEQMRERHKKASAKGKRPAPKKSPGRR